MSIHKRPNGKWKVAWLYQGRQFSRTFPRKEEAKAWQAEIDLAKNNPGKLRELTVPGHGVPTFNEFWPLWIEKHAKVFKSEGCAHEDENMIKKHLAPWIGNKKLTEITRAMATDMQAILAKTRKPRTVNSVIGLLKKMLNDAVYWEIIEDNPIRLVKPLKLGDQPFDFWSFEEAEKYVAWAAENDPELYTLASVILNTGLRRGEAEALLRSDLDFDRRLITVSKSFDYVMRKVKPPKGRRSRFIPMNRIVYADLKHLRDEPGDTKVFRTSMLLERLCGKKFKPSCIAAGVKPITIHDLRDTFASHLAMRGVPVTAIQALLGHVSVTTTQRYMHLSPAFMTGTTSALEARTYDIASELDQLHATGSQHCLKVARPLQ